VRTAGLRPTKEGVRVRSRRGALSVTEGPFTETKEVIGGYAIFSRRSTMPTRNTTAVAHSAAKKAGERPGPR
jgi:hypothetical protein